jgi:hypothetical protein
MATSLAAGYAIGISLVLPCAIALFSIGHLTYLALRRKGSIQDSAATRDHGTGLRIVRVLVGTTLVALTAFRIFAEDVPTFLLADHAVLVLYVCF